MNQPASGISAESKRPLRTGEQCGPPAVAQHLRDGGGHGRVRRRGTQAQCLAPGRHAGHQRSGIPPGRAAADPHAGSCASPRPGPAMRRTAG